MTTLRTMLPGAILGTLMLAGCASAATTAPPTPASAPTASPAAPTASPAATLSPSTPAATAIAPSRTPGINLSTLAGNWVASMENVRLHDARGRYQGGTMTVAGDQIALTYAGGKGAVYGRVGPTTISNCRPEMCVVQGTPPKTMWVVGDGTVVVSGRYTSDQTCGAPAVADGGLVVVAPGGNKISYVSSELGGLLSGSCTEGSWMPVWTQVLTRAP